MSFVRISGASTRVSTPERAFCLWARQWSMYPSLPIASMDLAAIAKEAQHERANTKQITARTIPPARQHPHHTAGCNYCCACLHVWHTGMDAYHSRPGFYWPGGSATVEL